MYATGQKGSQLWLPRRGPRGLWLGLWSILHAYGTLHGEAAWRSLSAAGSAMHTTPCTRAPWSSQHCQTRDRSRMPDTVRQHTLITPHQTLDVIAGAGARSRAAFISTLCGLLSVWLAWFQVLTTQAIAFIRLGANSGAPAHHAHLGTLHLTSKSRTVPPRYITYIAHHHCMRILFSICFPPAGCVQAGGR